MIDFQQLKESFRYAFRGLRYVFLYHQNLRIQTVFTASALVLGIILHLSFVEWVAVLLSIVLVLVAEMVNTAFEEMINLMKCEYDQRCKIAKDVSAGMVLLTAFFAIIVGILVFLPKIIQVFSVNIR